MLAKRVTSLLFLYGVFGVPALALALAPPFSPSCEGLCGSFNAAAGCFCDEMCTVYSDCCPDVELCFSYTESEACGSPNQPPCGAANADIHTIDLPSGMSPKVSGVTQEKICYVDNAKEAYLIQKAGPTECCTNEGGCPQAINFPMPVMVTKVAELPGGQSISSDITIQINNNPMVNPPKHFRSTLKLYLTVTISFTCQVNGACYEGFNKVMLPDIAPAKNCDKDDMGNPLLCISVRGTPILVDCQSTCPTYDGPKEHIIGYNTSEGIQVDFTETNIIPTEVPMPLPAPEETCAGSCGGVSPFGCSCDDLCTLFDDCCPDAIELCLSIPPSPPVAIPPPIDVTCEGSCGSQSPFGCFCDDLCTLFNDCCPDAVELCLSIISTSPPAFAILLGDVNFDGSVTVADVVIVSNFILGIAPLTGDAFNQGDINQDGSLTVSDIVGIINIILGI